MKKNKIVFVLVLVCVIMFIVAYSILILGKKETEAITSSQIPIPELDENQREYHSKLEALEAVKEEREITPPSVYPDHMIDEKGYFNPDYMEYEKQRIIDSIYQNSAVRYSEGHYKNITVEQESPKQPIVDTIPIIKDKEIEISTKELALEHQLFFASHPIKNTDYDSKVTDDKIYVKVDGTQTVKKDFRLQMRLSKSATIDGRNYPRNTLLYGFVSFKPNRTIINIKGIDHKPVKLKAFDLQDGSEGIYIENSFRAQATQELVDDISNDINIVGVPQVTGIKRLFQRNNRTVKITITDNYQLILKPNP